MSSDDTFNMVIKASGGWRHAGVYRRANYEFVRKAATDLNNLRQRRQESRLQESDGTDLCVMTAETKAAASEEDRFSRIRLKLNAAGSWCNAGEYLATDYEAVQACCVALAHCSVGRLHFRLLDAEGGELSSLAGYPIEWKEASHG